MEKGWEREKKEDGAAIPIESDGNGSLSKDADKAMVVENPETAPSALERLMESACSLCAPNTTSDST